MDYRTFLSGLHRFLAPRTYLEIGVNEGDTFALADCFAIGIDPLPKPRARALQNEKRKLYPTTSDIFFNNADVFEALNGMEIDLAFIDGMHLFEFALRDFINIERHGSFFTLVVFHDVLPAEPEWEGRQARQSNWTGDVWKIVPCLRKYRPELSVTVLDCPPSGLAIVTSLDPNSSILQDKFTEIEQEFLEIPFPGIEPLHDILQPTSPTEKYFSRFLRRGRGGTSYASPYQEKLKNLHPIALRPISDLLAVRPGSEVRELHKIAEATFRLEPAMFVYGPEDDTAYGAAVSQATHQGTNTVGAAHLIEVADAAVISQVGMIKLKDGTVVSESLWDLDDPLLLPHFSKNAARMTERRMFGRDEKFLLFNKIDKIIDDPCFLAKKRWYNNYGHWIIEILPKVLWAWETGYEGKFVIGARNRIEGYNAHLWSVMYEAFGILGIPEDRIMPIDDGDLVEFRRLAYASPLCKNPTFIHSAVKDLYRHFIQANTGIFEVGKNEEVDSRGVLRYPSRVFLTRRSAARNCLNEAQLVEVAEGYGFVPIDPGTYSFQDQVRLFRHAEMIIGVHGSAWANCVFTRDGCRTLLLGSVLFPDELYHKLFSVVGRKYGIVFGRPDKRRAVLHSDFTIDVQMFNSAVNRLIYSWEEVAGE